MSFEEEKPVLKIILVGSVGVGKTSIINKFFDSKVNKNEAPTLSPASCNATVMLEDGSQVELQIWDTAGQERYQSISQMFYRDSKVVIVCYTVDDEGSIGMWLERVRSHTPNSKVFLVTTKVDLLDPEQQSDCIERGSEYVTKFRCQLHLMTSAKSGYGITEIFQEAAKYYTEIDNDESADNIKINKSNGTNGLMKCCK